jgi:hypothetical protein
MQDRSVVTLYRIRTRKTPNKYIEQVKGSDDGTMDEVQKPNNSEMYRTFVKSTSKSNKNPDTGMPT